MKPKAIEQIEALWGEGFEMKLAQPHPTAREGVMRYRKGEPKYAVDEQGRLIGLNLAATRLTDDKWAKVLQIIDAEKEYLQALNLNENELQEFGLPEGLTALEWLDLSENRIEEFTLPPDARAVRRIYLRENPIAAPPPEIVDQGSAAVLAWYNSFRGEDERQPRRELKEIKVLLVGEGASGKTSLLKQIKGLEFDEYESKTHGVNVESLEMGQLPMFRGYEEVRDVMLHMWDFGGQEIMHASHQFFLTHRSIYIFVVDSRNDNRKDYWLRHIQKFGGDSPAIVAINKMDEYPSYSLEEATLNKKYPFVGNRFIKLSCKTKWGQEEFARTLARLIPQTELFRTPISQRWLSIKEQLQSETSNRRYIDQQRFIAICTGYGEETPEAQQAILGYLNALGVVLHFPRLTLQDFYVLDPHWVTIGVYRIINTQRVTDGMLHVRDLDYILNHEEQKSAEYDPSKEKKIRYSPAEMRYLVAIMKEFELLYEYDADQFLVPDLLPKEPRTEPDIERNHAVEFIMDYDFLPPNVMTRFIILMKDDIHDLHKLWRRGGYFTSRHHRCSALVVATVDDQRQRITIIVNGEEHRKREYFSVIYHHLCNINQKFKNLEVVHKMPVPGHPEIEYDYEELLALERMKEDRIVIGRLGQAFSVSRDFLNKLNTKEQRQQQTHGGSMPDIHLHLGDHNFYPGTKRGPAPGSQSGNEPAPNKKSETEHLQAQLIAKLRAGIQDIKATLNKLLSIHKEVPDELLILQGQFLDVRKQYHSSQMTLEEFESRTAKIRKGLLVQIADLELSQLDRTSVLRILEE